jgi:tetratricopeptide (TPR) repeat protein
MSDIDNAKRFFFEGLSYLDNRKFAAAESSFVKTLDLSPRSVPTLNNLAIAQYKQNKISQAAFTSKRAIEIDPDNVDSYSMLATCQIEQKFYIEALSTLERILSIDRRSSTPLQSWAYP